MVQRISSGIASFPFKSTTGKLWKFHWILYFSKLLYSSVFLHNFTHRYFCLWTSFIIFSKALRDQRTASYLNPVLSGQLQHFSSAMFSVFIQTSFTLYVIPNQTNVMTKIRLTQDKNKTHLGFKLIKLNKISIKDEVILITWLQRKFKFHCKLRGCVLVYIFFPRIETWLHYIFPIVL